MKQGAKDIAKQLLKKKLIAAIPAIAPFVLGVLGFVLVILAVVAPIAAAKEAVSQAGESVGTFFERFAGFFSGNGWNTDEEAYFKLLSDQKLGCNNSKIVTATIMYYYQVSSTSQIEMGEIPEEATDEEPATNVDEDGDNMYDETEYPYGKMLPDLKRLIKKIKPPNGNMDKYKKYVINKFLEKEPYSELLSDTEEGSQERKDKKQKIYEEMLAISESIECSLESSYGYYNFICPGVVVKGEGTFPLEEYVAGVVTGEGYLSENIEALKAQAIAARTYVLNRTDNCTKEIENSTNAQTFSPEPAEIAIKAASETAGQVLMYNGSVFSSQYDSFCYDDPDCPDAVKNEDGTYTVTYTKTPNNETHKITLNDSRQFSRILPGQGHARGMSQLVSYQLADSGLNYSEILKYFYSDGVEISSSLAGGPGLLAADSTGFSRRISWPDTSSGSDSYFWFSNNNLSYQGGYTGQCTWYVFGRANEILAAAGSSYRWKHAPDAGQWYKYNLNDGENGFKSSMNINEPKVGSIMVLSGNGAGHVMMVEAVYEDGDIAISEANVRINNPNPYGFRYIEKISPSAYVAQFPRYSFGGYIYLLD